MGLAPADVKVMTLWEFQACVHGWNKSQGKGYAVEGEIMTDDAYDALCGLGDMWNGIG